MYFRYKKKVLSTPGRVAPEARLPEAFIGAIALVVGLFWFAWTNSPSIHWMASIAAGVPFGFGMVIIYFSANAYNPEPPSTTGASATAAAATAFTSQVDVRIHLCF